jgi:hypothetical protein
LLLASSLRALAGKCSSNALLTESNDTAFVASNRAPSKTTFAILALPTSVAKSFAWISITVMSWREAGLTMSERLMTSTPPGLRSASYLSIEGLLSTTAAVGLRIIGAPISSSDTMTMQCAVPPRISGP